MHYDTKTLTRSVGSSLHLILFEGNRSRLQNRLACTLLSYLFDQFDSRGYAYLEPFGKTKTVTKVVKEWCCPFVQSRCFVSFCSASLCFWGTRSITVTLCRHTWNIPSSLHKVIFLSCVLEMKQGSFSPPRLCMEVRYSTAVTWIHWPVPAADEGKREWTSQI